MARPNTVHVKDPQLIREAISKTGRTYRDLADASGVSRSMIGHLVSGDRHSVSFEKAERLASVLSVPASDLFEVPEFDRIAQIARGGSLR